jgi:hypothetical protein
MIGELARAEPASAFASLKKSLSQEKSFQSFEKICDNCQHRESPFTFLVVPLLHFNLVLFTYLGSIGRVC